MTAPTFFVRRVCEQASLPQRMSKHAAGLDLAACLPGDEEVTLAPGQRALVPTGLQLAIPPGYEGQVRPRSGLALRHGIALVNAPGTIDADYRGELQVILVNLGQEPYTVRHGDRVAQLVLAPVVAFDPIEVDELPASGDKDPVTQPARGAGGFGSTGR